MADLTEIMILYPPPRDVVVKTSIALPDWPGLDALIAVCQPYIAPGRFGWRGIERVRVFHNGEYLDMMVDSDWARKHLPANLLATTIYHESLRVHAPEQLGDDPPKIYGPAVLFMRRVWF